MADQYEKHIISLIELAKEGEVQAARALLGYLSSYIRGSDSIPEPLKNYFIPRLDKLEEEGNPKIVLNLNPGRGRPKPKYKVGFEIVFAVQHCIDEHNLPSAEQAFGRLYEEGFRGLSESRIHDLYYKNIKGYNELFGLPEHSKE